MKLDEEQAITEGQAITEEQATTWPTMQRIASLYNIPIQTLYKAARTGRLPHVKIGTGRHAIYLLAPEGVDSFLSAYRRRTRQQPSPSDHLD